MAANNFVANLAQSREIRTYESVPSTKRALSRKRSAPKNPLPVVPKKTHQQLLDEFSFSSSNQERAKRVSRDVHQWWTFIKITPSSKVRGEYKEDFEASLKRFLEKLSEEGSSNGTLYNKASSIRTFERFVREQMGDQSLPETFTERLRYLLAERDLVPNQLREEVSETAYHWAILGTTPQARSINTIKKLETFLQVVPGTLSDLLAKAKVPVLALNADVSYRLAKARQSRQFAFRLNTLPDQLEAEFQRLIAHKKQAMFRIVDPVTKKVSTYTTQTSERWNSPKTISIYRQHVARFFGYLTLPKANEAWENLSDADKLCFGKHGKSLEELSLLDLVNHEYLSDFISYCLVRGEQTFSQNEMHFGTFVNMLVNKPHSYFPMSFARYGSVLGLDQVEYREWCQARHSETLDVCAAIRPLVRFDKASKDVVVNDLLRSDNPLKILRAVSDKVLSTSKPSATAPVQAAKAFRDHLLLEILIHRPIRIGEVALLRLGETVVKQPDGQWKIHIPRGLLKNSIHPYAIDLEVLLGNRISTKIDTYLADHRPHLLDGRESKALFLMRERNVSEPECNPEQLSRIVSAVTKTFFTVGFGPHVLRHIWTTHYLNNNPGDFKGAAALLNDSEEVVRNSYDKSNAQDALKRIDAFREKTMGEAQ